MFLEVLSTNWLCTIADKDSIHLVVTSNGADLVPPPAVSIWHDEHIS